MEPGTTVLLADGDKEAGMAGTCPSTGQLGHALVDENHQNTEAPTQLRWKATLDHHGRRIHLS
jgi:hypothetical protein